MKENKMLKSFRLDFKTIEKINEIKNEVFKESQTNISYGDIVVSAFKYADTTDLVNFIVDGEKQPPDPEPA